MKESKLYLEYFRKNLVVLVLAMVVGGGVGLIFTLRQPTLYKLTQLIEMDYDQSNVQSRVTLGDELVSTTRAAGLEHQLGMTSAVDLVKTGPLSITLTLSSKDPNQLSTDLSKLSDYVAYRFPIHKLGDPVFSKTQPNKLIYLLVGVGLGFLIGNLYSLLRIYLKDY